MTSKFQVKITGQGAVFGGVAFVFARADDEFRDLGHGGGTGGTDELHQHPFGRMARRGAHVGPAREGQPSGADREETLRFGRGEDYGEAAPGSQQAEDGVAQVVERQVHGMAGRGAPLGRGR